MRWILVDVVLGLVAVGLLAVVGLSVWRRVKALGREVSRAGELLDRATAQLEQVRTGDTRPTPARHP